MKNVLRILETYSNLEMLVHVYLNDPLNDPLVKQK